jgi:hypothetical protein
MHFSVDLIKTIFDGSMMLASKQAFHADAKTYYDGHGCYAWVNTKGCVWKEEAPETATCAECTASAVADSYITEIDALAEACALSFPAMSGPSVHACSVAKSAKFSMMHEPFSDITAKGS